MATLCAHDDVKNALLRSALELTRDQLDRGESRDAFWSTCVAKVFNDSTWRPQLPLQGVVEDCDPTVFQGRQKTGPELKKLYWETRSSFTLCYERRSRSGQNDPDAFISFVPCRPGRLPCASAKRLLIMFAAFRCGTPLERTDVLQFTVRTLSHEVGREEGMDCTEAETVRRSLSNRRNDDNEAIPQSQRKKQRRNSSHGDDSALKAIASATNSLCASLTPSSHAPTPAVPTAHEIVRSKLHTIRDLAATISALESECTEHDGGVLENLRAKISTIAEDI